MEGAAGAVDEPLLWTLPKLGLGFTIVSAILVLFAYHRLRDSVKYSPDKS